MEERQDLINRQAAIDQLHQSYNLLDAERRLEELPSAQQKALKYSGDSICVYCKTADCDGCIYEPMEGVMNG